MKRLHPLSAVFRALNAGSAGLGVGLVLTGVVFGGLLGGPGLESAVMTFVGAALGALVGVAYGVAQYFRFEYDVHDGTVSIARGVLARTERDIPFGRIQNVDIERGIVSRLLGVATVNLETAGGGSTEAVLAVVALAEAERIQNVVAGYEQAANAPDGSDEATESTTGVVEEDSPRGDPVTATAGTTKPSEERAAEGESDSRPGPTRETLFELSNGDLAVLSAVSFDASGLALLIFTIPFGQEFAFEVFSRTLTAVGGPSIPSLAAVTGLPTLQLVVVLLVGAVQFLLAAWAASAVITAVKYYDFRLTKVGEDLRYERGLLGRYTGTIPLEKVQGITVRENAPMRRFGFAALDLETAGYGPDQAGDASNTAIPLDDRGVVIALAERLGDVEYPEIQRPPKRARRRYAVRFSFLPIGLAATLFAVDWLLYSLPRWWIPLLALPLAPVAGHYTWKHRGHALAKRAFVARSSFWRRHCRIVPYYRVQTVIDSRSVFQRWRNLATVTADTASTASVIGGDATAHDVDEETAVEIHQTLRERLAADLGRRRGKRDRSSTGTGPESASTGTETARGRGSDEPTDGGDVTE